jgi:hypothetical protein
MIRLLVSARIAPHSETDRLGARHALPIVDPNDGREWHETFAGSAWIATTSPAPVVLRHDGPCIGFVFSVTPCGAWHEAALVLEVDDEQRDLIHPGRAVSIDARSIRRDDDALARVRRHTLAQLQAVAVLVDGERPVYDGARIVSVREAPARTSEGQASQVVIGGERLVRHFGKVLAVR